MTGETIATDTARLEARMQVGLMAPQGWKGEYDGWRPPTPGPGRSSSRAQAEALGFESLWVFDHFHTVPEPTDEITFESFSVLAALAMATERVRLGHMVVCTGFRNPALTAKLSSTIDVISGGRFELGIGAGWKEDEWRAYGYGFPPLAERMAALGDHLEVISAMFAPGRATLDGRVAHVRGAINVPQGSSSRTSRSSSAATADSVTAGYAIRYADELNYVFLAPTRSPSGCAEVRERCETRGPRSRRRSGSRCTPATSRCATPGRPGSTCLGALTRRSGSTASSRSRRAGHRRSRRRRPSPTTAGRPGSRSTERVRA